MIVAAAVPAANRPARRAVTGPAPRDGVRRRPAGTGPCTHAAARAAVIGDRAAPPPGDLLLRAVEGMDRPLFVLDEEWRFAYDDPAGAAATSPA